MADFSGQGAAREYRADPRLLAIFARTLAGLRPDCGLAARARDLASQGAGGHRVGGRSSGLYLLYFLVSLPIVARVEERHLSYVSPHFYLVAVMVFYVLGTCISSLLSSHRAVRWFGFTAVLSFVAAYAFYAAWFISVWCFFAAVLSGVVLLHFPRRPAKSPDSGQPQSA